jgi:myo-inositol-1(or 4)-monophosphatase
VGFGAGGPARVVIDPIDGSLNARRTVPSHSLSVAIASGPSMADVELAYVYDFGAGEEFVARRGVGATLDEAPIRVGADSEGLELLGVESAEPARTLPLVEALAGRVYRLRVVGSIAITASYVAAGRFDGMLSLRPCRSVDAAAAQLIVREAGGVVAFGDLAANEAGLALDARYPIAAAAGERSLATIRAAVESTE